MRTKEAKLNNDLERCHRLLEARRTTTSHHLSLCDSLINAVAGRRASSASSRTRFLIRSFDGSAQASVIVRTVAATSLIQSTRPPATPVAPGAPLSIRLLNIPPNTSSEPPEASPSSSSSLCITQSVVERVRLAHIRQAGGVTGWLAHVVELVELGSQRSRLAFRPTVRGCTLIEHLPNLSSRVHAQWQDDSTNPSSASTSPSL